MKTRICDICGKTEHELMEMHMAKIYRFNATFPSKIIYGAEETKPFDICTNCLKVIREKSRGE